MSKDLFSEQAKLYEQYRPHYPAALFEYILSFVNEKGQALDVATGNGQAAVALCPYFETIEAIDLSVSQLAEATQKDNIRYSVSNAESTSFPDNSFDLITIATAYHWLDFEAFHKEVTRIGKPGSVVAAWAYYTLFTGEEKLDQLYQHFYHDIVGPYWDPERKYVDDQYRTVAFEFEPLPLHPFETIMNWTKEEFKGYLLTWSATQRYIKEKGNNPIVVIEYKLDKIWNDTDTKAIRFPICMKLGRIKKP